MKYPNASAPLSWKIWIWLLALLLAGCSTCSVRKSIHQAGEKAGEAIGEAAKGVSGGVENAFDIKIEKKEGAGLESLEFGKILLNSDSTGTDNKISAYIIFNSDFDRTVTLKVFDRKGLEEGRVRKTLSGKSDEAGYVDFVFDPKTNIDRDCRIVME